MLRKVCARDRPPRQCDTRAAAAAVCARQQACNSQDKKKHSATGTRTRVARVRAEYPNQLDYSGSEIDARRTLHAYRQINKLHSEERSARSRVGSRVCVSSHLCSDTCFRSSTIAIVEACATCVPGRENLGMRPCTPRRSGCAPLTPILADRQGQMCGRRGSNSRP